MGFFQNFFKRSAKTKAEPTELARPAAEHSFKPESNRSNIGDFANIVAAKVLNVQKHPNADRLRIIKLDIGDQLIEPVICGAFNFGVGDIVVLALPGAKIAQNIHSETHESFVLGKAKIRGIESQGMICAAFELGLTTEPGDKPEIMLLKSDVLPGSQFSSEMIK